MTKMETIDAGVRNIRRFYPWPVRHDGDRVLMFHRTVVASIDPWVAMEASREQVACMAKTLGEANYAHATGVWSAPPA